MTEQAIESAYNDDGSVDLGFFERAGLGWVKRWLTERLSGSDPYFPIDGRVDEDPDAFIAGILREAGSAHPAAALISRAVLYLLERAGEVAPDTPAYFPSLLRLCQRVRLPQAASWFTEQIAELAGRPARVEERWGGYEISKEIGFAALCQAPGLPNTASRRSWERLLRTPRYATIGLLGVGQSFAERVLHLRRWWESCPAAEHHSELDAILFRALRADTGDEQRVLNLLRSAGRSYPQELREAIDRALVANGARAAFTGMPEGELSRHSITNATVDAGLRPEFLVPAG